MLSAISRSPRSSSPKRKRGSSSDGLLTTSKPTWAYVNQTWYSKERIVSHVGRYLFERYESVPYLSILGDYEPSGTRFYTEAYVGTEKDLGNQEYAQMLIDSNIPILRPEQLLLLVVVRDAGPLNVNDKILCCFYPLPYSSEDSVELTPQFLADLMRTCPHKVRVPEQD